MSAEHRLRPSAPCFVVGIAGGSCSGKTTLARALAETLGQDRVALLPHDAYYRDPGDLDPAGMDRLDYDAPEAFDQSRFRADLHRLARGEGIVPPRYCFVSHRRIGTGDPVEPREIVLVEGLLLFHDPDVRDVLDLRIFVDAPVELRRQRRVARDAVERGRTPESVLRQFAATVHPAHVAYVDPTRQFAHLVLLNAGRFDAVVEVAAAAIRAHLGRAASRAPATALSLGRHGMAP